MNGSLWSSFIVILSYLELLLLLALCCQWLKNKVFEYSDQKCKWVKRQHKLLDAILKDINDVKYSVKQIKIRMRQTGGLELKSLKEIKQSLEEINVKKISELRDSMWQVTRDFEGLSNTKTLLKSSLITDCVNFLPTIDNFIDMKRATKETEESLRDQRAVMKKISELLEQTREQVRSLQDRPIGHRGNVLLVVRDPFNKDEIMSSLEKLTVMGQNTFQGTLAGEVRLAVIRVKLVHTLVTDLRWVKLETTIEKAWLQEALDVIKSTEHSIVHLWDEEQRLMRWPEVYGIRDWLERSAIRKKIAYIDRQFTDLLEAKSRYSIKFLRRISKKHVRRRRLNRAGDGGQDILSILVDVRTMLGDNFPAESQLYCKVLELCKDVDSVERVLKEERVEEGAIHTREACYELLKTTAMEVESRLSGMLETSEIDQISRAVKLLEEMAQVCSIKLMSESPSVVGFDEDVHGLVSILVALSEEAGGQNGPAVLSIMGTQGIGKTTLAKEIMNNSSIMTKFKTRMINFSKEGDINFWVQEIKDFLTSQACLVVLDNLPSKKAWDSLKHVFPESRRTIVIVTTGSKEVSEYVNPGGEQSRTHKMRLRTEEESWDLFTQMVNFPTNADAETKSLAKNVVAKTGGLPLAIMQLAYLLFRKDNNKEELTKILDRDHIARDQWLITWRSNKDDFESKPDLARCFWYSEFFPANFKIPARRLLALWVASGSVQSDKEANRCLQELVDRNVIQIVNRKRNGTILTCRFPSTLRDIWVKDARNKVIRARSWSLFARHDRRLAYCFDDKDNIRSVQGLNSDAVHQVEKYPQSMMFFDTSDGNKPNEDIGNFLLKGIASRDREFWELLVLDLEGVFRPQLPNTIGKLKKLTYLGLRWTSIETLPDAIGELSQLRTLDLKHTFVKSLPATLWKMKALQHLYLSETCRIKLIPKLSSMKNLETLSGVFLDHEGSGLCSGLDKLPNLQQLGVTISQLPLKHQNLLKAGIAKLTKLVSLSLRSINIHGCPRELKLNSMSDLSSLTNLYLLGKLEGSSVFEKLTVNLTQLTLSASELSDDPVSLLETLSELKFLSLISKSYTGTHMVFNENIFPKLLVLHVWSLPNLESLEIMPGAMPNLREFEIRNCNKLMTTQGLTNLMTLQELKLTNMAHHQQFIDNEFASARENSSEKVLHCPNITKKNRELLQEDLDYESD